MHLRLKTVVGSALAVAALGGVFVEGARASNWNVARVNHMLLMPPAGVIVKEMSGVTYVGPAGGDSHRFIAAQENAKQDAPGTKGVLVQFDLTFNASGGITAISNITQLLINPILDFEGIAYTDAAHNSVFLSEENTPGIREVSLATTLNLQTLTAPAVFTANKRSNLGFESLTRTLDGTVMWTANEAALTVDGPVATAAAGTNVRLLKLEVAGNVVANGPQFAYQVAPIHDPNTLGSPQSGLSDLVAMPDGTLLTLERSVAVASPLYLNRVYEVNLSGATDVSQGALANGLTGQSYTPVAKELLWSGAVDGPGNSGMNMEGLALGPRLANGSWVLVGVCDDGDGFTSNTVVAFTATSNPTADFDASGSADGADFLAWQRGFGKTVGAKLSDGDADRDGDVDDADLSIWKAASAVGVAVQAPEPSSAALLAAASVVAFGIRRRGTSNWLKAGSR